jgi:lantibiotic modifying enzyme
VANTTITFAASQTTATRWRPILIGELHDRARGAVELIDHDLARRAEELVDDPCLSGGSAGLALYYAYQCQADRSERAERRAIEWLDRAITGACRQSLAPGLYSGFTGVAWTLAHLSDADDRADDNQFTIIDDSLAAFLEQRADAYEYELINGLVGLGVYTVERLPSPTAQALLAQIIDRMDRRSLQTPDGITWWTPAQELPAHERAEFPGGYANIGVSHGMPGVIGLLAQAVCRGVAVQQSVRLLSGAVEWLLAQRLHANADAHFGYHVGAVGASEPARLAWCYGDLGIAAVLLAAAQATGESTWRREAIQIARTAAARTTLEASGVEDAGLCHGAAGVAHLFNRMYQATGDPVLLHAAQHWIAATLQMHSDEHGVGGFPARQTRGPQAGQWVDDPGFLEGAAGVGLALLAATTSIAPQWDRLLLCSLPNR